MRAILVALFVGLLLGSTLAWGRHWTWRPPTTRGDGAPYPVAEQGGYRFYCGRSRRGPFAKHLDIPDSTTTSVDFIQAVDTAYCYLTAYDRDGLESVPSNIVGQPLAPSGAKFD